MSFGIFRRVPGVSLLLGLGLGACYSPTLTDAVEDEDGTSGDTAETATSAATTSPANPTTGGVSTTGQTTEGETITETDAVSEAEGGPGDPSEGTSEGSNSTGEDPGGSETTTGDDTTTGETDSTDPTDPTDDPPDCSPSTGGPIYVDPVEGTDGDGQGGGAGACAVRSIGYALGLAGGEIRLAGGLYEVEEAIELTAGQRLVCSAVDMATLRGQPAFSTWHVSVRLTGAGSGIENCQILGEGNSGYCLEVTAGGTEVEGTYMTNCGGAAVRTLVSGATFTGNRIEHSNTHLFFQGSFSATANGNTFIGTPAYNVSCNGSASSITGSGNTGTQGCNPNCNCPSNFFN